MKKYLVRLLMRQRSYAYQINLENILKFCSLNNKAKILDLGCDDGVWTPRVANKIETDNIHGVELIKDRAKEAEQNNIKVKISDLNEKFPYRSNTFDVIHSNQVIEHLSDTDNFMSEIYRLLKPKGYAIISTENLASWHNIFALLFGFTPFSLTNISEKTAALGNPFAPHDREEFWERNTWQHQRIFTTKGLKHLSELHGFKNIQILTSGYYPLGNMFAKLDPSHSAFITFRIEK